MRPPCSKVGCTNPATKIPTLTFAAEAQPDGPRAQMTIGSIPVCADHATDDPNAYVTDEGWDMVCAKLMEQGRAKPGRSTLRVEYLDIA